MSADQWNAHESTSSPTLTKDQQKKRASSFKTAHILSILAKSKFIQTGDRYVEGIAQCLNQLDSTHELSIILEALQFSGHVDIVFDFDKANLESVAKSDALGWFNDREKELLLGAKKLFKNRKTFLGVFAHELCHWCMTIVFKNEGRPYFTSDPKHKRKQEFADIVDSIHNEIVTQGIKHDPIIQSVFEYDEDEWHRELIVRVPHMIAQYGLDESVKIMTLNSSTQRLLRFYQSFVMSEIEKFITNGALEGSRQSVARLNKTLGLLNLYQEFNFHFIDEAFDFPESSSLLVCSSSHPYLSFMKIAWTLNCLQPNDGFYENNVFCDFNSFEDNLSKILQAFDKMDECKTLYLVCAKVNSESYRNLIDWLEMIWSKAGKKVIMIIANMLRRATEKQLRKMQCSTSNCIMMRKVEIQDLDDSSRKTILNQPITMFGEVMTLGDVIDEDELQIADGIFIERLLRKEDIVVGEKADSPYDRPPGFVSLYEKITVQRVVDLVAEESFTGDDYFLIMMGNSENYAEPIRDVLCKTFDVMALDELFVSTAEEIDICESRHVVLLSPGTKFSYSECSQIVENLFVNEFETCYFINIESKETIFCDSMYLRSIAFDRILQRKYVQNGAKTAVDVQEVTDMLLKGNPQLLILSDEAGSGKSQFLNSIYHSIADRWVVKVSLKSCISYIDRHSLTPDLNKEHAVTFLAALGQIQDKFAKDLLREKMEKHSKFSIILMLDGFDEITASDQNSAPTNKEKISNLLLFLIKSTKVTTIITTRPESEVHFNNLSPLIYHFTSISEEDRLEFIEHFFLSRIELITESESAMQLIFNSLVLMRKELQKIIGSTDFFETPLHLKMFADIYVESQRAGCLVPTVFASDGDLKIDSLYSEFIKMKYRIYFKEKNKNRVDDLFKETVDSAFRKLALFSLYGNEECCKSYFQNDNLFFIDSQDRVSINCDAVRRYFDIGIISSSTSSNVTFVHITFAEYFVSQIFIQWSQENLLYKKVILEVIYQPGKSLTRFYEHLLHSTSYSEDMLKAHGNFMTDLNIQETMDMLDGHIKLNHFNIVDYVLKCWRLVGKSHLLHNQETKEANRLLRLFRVLHDTMAGHGFPYTFDYDYEGKAYHQINHFAVDNFSCSINEEDLLVCLRLFEKGKLELLKYISPDVGNEQRSRMVFLAAASGCVDALSWLEDSGCDFNVRTVTGASAVTLAIRKGKLEAAKWLKERGVSIEWMTNYAETLAIHDAVITNQFPAIQWLIEEGSNINSADRHGSTPLHLTLKCYGFYDGLFDKVKLLCDLGADVNSRSNHGFSTMHYAGGVVDQEVLKFLVSRGCSFGVKTDDGRSPLHTAFLPDGILFSVTRFLQQPSSLNKDSIQYNLILEGSDNIADDLSLILKNVDVNMCDNSGLTAAHIALNTLNLVAGVNSDAIHARLFLSFKRVVKCMAESNPDIVKEISSCAENMIRRNQQFHHSLAPVIEWCNSSGLDFTEYEIIS